MTRKIEKTIEIDADAETVWRAIAEGEGLARWFAPDARVTPGVGGGVWLSWGEGMEWESPIEVWEPNRHLRTADEMPTGKIAVDYYLETSGGKTVLRLVHSGFADDTWEGELDALDAGWSSFFQNLKLYVERHRGEPREMAWFRHEPLEIPIADAFRRTLEALGLSPSVKVGDRYRTSNGLEGTVLVSAPPRGFSGTIANYDDGFLMVEVEGGKVRCRPAIWISLYGEQRKHAEEWRTKVRELLTATFG
ncbi:MAG TPA: SRPBCC domain-containing protein [Thermoanaerobaculia bacterium]|jgi:uncharacterized protein YndB with AHSA1/START domain